MQRIKKVLLPVALFAVLLTLWWYVVVSTESVIFPTPQQVVLGVQELALDGTLW